ncbi:outer membrane beta-barrel protein [Lysobacter sp. TAF61]|uniref:outer membrane beta-barrel protein n=1 Tax=Lysobacter sp. TAF61 TaxID=3233072 RepID=UPI003F9C8427
MRKFNVLVLALAMAGACTAASAAEGSGVYVRGEVGNSTLYVDGDSAVDTAMNGWLGYSFNSLIGVEAHYGSLGKDSGDGASVEMNATGLGLRLKHEFAGGYYIAGRAGMERIESEFTDAGFGIQVRDEDQNPYAGLGMGFNVNKSFAVTGYWDTREVPFFGDTQRVDTLTIGGEFRF